MSAAVLHKRNLAQAVHDLIKHSSPDGADIAATIDALAYVISDLVNMPMMLTLMHESDAKKYLVEYAKRKSAPAVAPEKSKAAAACANCGGSGRNQGSTSLDCTHCNAATERVELGTFLDNLSLYDERDVSWAVHQRAYAMGVKKDPWQPIETAPRGVNGVSFMRLAWGPKGDASAGDGIRIGDDFYTAGTFYCLGQKKQYELREIKVAPTHWMPLPDAPKVKP